MISTFSCQSGSNGNCIFVRAGNTRLLFDAGLTGKCAALRLASRGENISLVDAVILSHDHRDHVHGAGVLHRRHGIPLHMSAGTYDSCLGRNILGKVSGVRVFTSGETICIGDARVHTIATPHDGTDGVCFVVEYGGLRLGILTDLGFSFPALQDLLPTLDAVYLESNYDPDMLESGPYPFYLQQRIRGSGGHISNTEAARLVQQCTNGRLQWVALSHLSESNNTPEMALRTFKEILADHPCRLPIHTAGRYEASVTWTLERNPAG